jgi:hypothetical protein
MGLLRIQIFACQCKPNDSNYVYPMDLWEQELKKHVEHLRNILITSE